MGRLLPCATFFTCYTCYLRRASSSLPQPRPTQVDCTQQKGSTSRAASLFFARVPFDFLCARRRIVCPSWKAIFHHSLAFARLLMYVCICVYVCVCAHWVYFMCLLCVCCSVCDKANGVWAVRCVHTPLYLSIYSNPLSVCQGKFRFLVPLRAVPIVPSDSWTVVSDASSPPSPALPSGALTSGAPVRSWNRCFTEPG